MRRREEGQFSTRTPSISAKFSTELEFFADNWTVHLHAAHFDNQDDVATFETPTDSYTLVSVYADYHWGQTSKSEVKLFVKANNLFDEEIRNHSSFIKHFAPEPGRNVTIGLRIRY